jgi:hypothetical protein
VDERSIGHLRWRVEQAPRRLVHLRQAQTLKISRSKCHIICQHGHYLTTKTHGLRDSGVLTVAVAQTSPFPHVQNSLHVPEVRYARIHRHLQRKTASPPHAVGNPEEGVNIDPLTD